MLQSIKIRDNTYMKNICFIHIPKCGGTSIRSSIKKNWLNIFLNRKLSLNHVASSKAAESLNVDVLAFREQLLRFYLYDPQHKFVFGHFRCTSETRQLFQENWSFVTLIRDPVKRWLSHYYFDKFRTTNVSYNKTDLGLEKYLNSEEGIRNARMFIRHYTDYVPGAVLREGLVEEAVENIKGFDVYGILEDMHSFAKSYKTVTGSSLKVRESNKNPKRGYDQDNIPQELMDQIIELNKYDINIYERIKSSLKN